MKIFVINASSIKGENETEVPQKQATTQDPARLSEVRKQTSTYTRGER